MENLKARKACLFVAPAYLKGEIFNPENKKLNRDNLLAIFHEIKRLFLDNEIDINTQDIHAPEESDFILYNEMPQFGGLVSAKERSFGLLYECEVIRPDNWKQSSHGKFQKIFTWHDGFKGNEKYRKINFTHSGAVDFLEFDKKKGFCTLIAGRKSAFHKYELYSEREKSIRWFEKNHPQDFEFYGAGWDRLMLQGSIVLRALNRIRPLGRLLAGSWPSYKGMVDNKLETLRQYKFSICYENAQMIPGYITEKIFDSFVAGCVPVYWGAPNIEEYVPKECFIDRRNFSSHEDLYKFLIGIDRDRYAEYQQAIFKYLQSEQHKQFTPTYVADVIVKNILSSMREKHDR